MPANDLVSILREHNWPWWAIAMILGLVAISRRVIMGLRAASGRGPNKVEIENMSMALKIALAAEKKVELANARHLECEERVRASEGNIAELRLEMNELIRRGHLDELDRLAPGAA